MGVASSEGDEIAEQIPPTLSPSLPASLPLSLPASLSASLPPSLSASPHPEFAKAQAHRCPQESARIGGRVVSEEEGGVEIREERATERERSP